MNQIFTIKLNDNVNDNVCSSCFCKDQMFLHHVWDGNKGHKICTSCVLFSHKFSFCPTCFDLYVFPLREKLIRCNRCRSYSHAKCFSANGNPAMCSTCRNPDGLIFDLKALKPKGENGYYKGMDMKAAGLLLAAAKVVQNSIFKAHDESAYSAVVQVTQTVLEKKKAICAMKRVMQFEESNDGPSLLDSSPETSRET